MGRLLAVDYGGKRCGIAVTDSLQISINPLDTVHPDALINRIKGYLESEAIEKLLIGWPSHKDGRQTYLADQINSFLTTFAKLYPDIEIVKVDESFTSFEAKNLIFASGAKKKKRRDKALLDRMSAVIIIKRYLDHL